MIKEDGEYVVNVIDTLSKKVELSDEKPSVAYVEAKEAVTLTPDNTIIDIDNILDKIELKVKDQYGYEIEDAKATYKIASIVPNADGYAENNFKVTKNDTDSVKVEGAERGDTFVLTVKVGNKEVTVKCTVGADAKANILNSFNSYLDTLVSEKLEPQRIDGLQ